MVSWVPYLPTGPSFSQQDLRAELGDFASRFHLLVTAAADSIDAGTTDRAVRKRTLSWRVQMIPLVQEAAFQPDPQEAFVEILTLVVMMRQYLSEGEGRQLLGAQQAIALEAAQQLEQDLSSIGLKFLSADALAATRREVEDFAHRRPIAGQTFAIQNARRALAEVEQTSAVQRVVAVPLAPFRALEGVGDSSTAIREFTATAREFVRAVERLPEQARWQVELLLYDVEDRDTTLAALASLESVTRSVERVSESAARLPDDLREALQDSGETLARVEQLLTRAREVADPLRETAQSLELASASWATIMGPKPEAARERGRPFDVREWESTATEIGAAAERLAQLVGELRGLADARPLDAALAPVGTVLDRADLAGRGWIDHAALRVAQLLAVLFALLLAYRWLAPRLGSAPVGRR
jgi:hypothetical protein